MNNIIGCITKYEPQTWWVFVEVFKDSSALTKSSDMLDPKQDLVNLIAKQTHVLASYSSEDDEKDIPPLIQAITRFF